MIPQTLKSSSLQQSWFVPTTIFNALPCSQLNESFHFTHLLLNIFYISHYKNDLSKHSTTVSVGSECHRDSVPSHYALSFPVLWTQFLTLFHNDIMLHVGKYSSNIQSQILQVSRPGLLHSTGLTYSFCLNLQSSVSQCVR